MDIVNQDIKVSVIIPVYNEEKYLEECLDSVLAQTLREIEIICVDDGSDDDSVKILEDYAGRDSRVSLLKQKNRYAGNARNLGMSKAVGRYLSFLDADDIFSPFLLEKMYDAAEKETADVIICNARYYDSETGEITRREKWELMPEAGSCFCAGDIPGLLFQITNGWAWDKLFSADFIRQCGLYFSGTRTANDGYFVYMALAQAGRIVKIEDHLVCHRFNNAASLANTRNKSWHCGFEMLYDIKKGLEERNLYQQLEKTFLDCALYYLIWSVENMNAVEIKKKIYQCIQEECRQIIPISGLPEERYYHTNEYEQYRYIETHSFDEYLTLLLQRNERTIQSLSKECTRLRKHIQQKIWPFPYSSIEKNSQVVLYGAGRVGQDYYQQIVKSGYCRLVLWLDKRFETGGRELSIHGWREELSQISFHKIIIALLKKEEAESAMKMLNEWGIPEEKILWEPEET